MERRPSLDCSHISGKIYIKSRYRADRKDLKGVGGELDLSPLKLRAGLNDGNLRYGLSLKTFIPF